MDGLRKLPLEAPERISGITELAFNMWWSWHPEARALFKRLSRPAWKLSGHNPVKMLGEIDKGVLEEAAGDAEFLAHYDQVMEKFQKEMKDAGRGWFADNVCDPNALPVVFFSAEYGLHHSLPFYAGGLGFLAGDFLKESSDLGMPVTAIGFMYPEGYLRQKIPVNGWQESLDEPLDRASAAISRVLDSSGKPLLVKVPFIEPPIHVEVWKIEVGRISLYLIDTDIEANDPWNRSISAHLYIGNLEQRLRQEIVLGIGGREVLDTMGMKHSVLHLNEGHPAFAITERIRERVAEGMSFENALRQVKETTIFTTHTPVPAGTDVFPFALMEKYFSSYWPALGLDREGFFKLGMNPEDPGAGFNMTVFALKCSSHRNGVSKRHGQVARRIWHSLWPDRPEDKVPIGHVTNGIHVPTWIEPKMDLLFNRYLGENWKAAHDRPETWEAVRDIPDKELWNTHYWLKMKLIMRIMERARQRWIEDRPEAQIILGEGVMLDPNALTIGFARRFASYKRASLILRDAERLKRILNDKWRPVQIIFAGKAHPADDPAKNILQQVFNSGKDPAFGGRIAFVEEYDEQLAQYLVHGVDLWLNNPLPPLEASGTSGMKAALNGVPSLSILDGWWIEGFNGKNGWAFGEEPGRQDTTPRPDRDADDAEAIYRLLEQQIVPLYYHINGEGISTGWVRVMKEAIISTAAQFSARRMVKEYASNYYAKCLLAVKG
ncbi:MAG: alpha-glucan family phosphorylase [Nitrospiraceae bacterium]|nr:alpha-glucan family phosphorylase [Nitrospiraceae bacterium]